LKSKNRRRPHKAIEALVRELARRNCLVRLFGHVRGKEKDNWEEKAEEKKILFHGENVF